MASIVDTTAKVAGGNVGVGRGVSVAAGVKEGVLDGTMTTVVVNSTDVIGVGLDVQELRTSKITEMLWKINKSCTEGLFMPSTHETMTYRLTACVSGGRGAGAGKSLGAEKT